MKTQKVNVQKFNNDINENHGYKYTTNATFSSIVANRRMTEATIKYIPKDTKTILDIGCGDGTYTNDLKVRFPEIDFTGFDPAIDAIESAKKSFLDINYVNGDLLNDSTFPLMRFDLCIVRGVLHHLPDALTGIKNCGKLGDRIIIIEPNGNNPILKLIEKKSQYHIDHEEQSFSSDKLLSWCEVSELKVKKIDFIGFVPFFFPTFISKLIYFFQPLLEKIYPLKKYFAAQIVIYCEK